MRNETINGGADETASRMLRYEIPIDDEWHDIEGPWEILHYGCRRPDVVEFWGLVSTGPYSAPLRTRRLRVFGTGQPIEGDFPSYQATVIAPGGALVWHVFRSSIPSGIPQCPRLDQFIGEDGSDG